MELKPTEFTVFYISLHYSSCASALLLGFYIGQDFYNAGQRREVVQAADFLIKEARKLQTRVKII
jgi:hypothetical protein